MAKSKPKKVKARLLRGFRDYLPEELIAREQMITTIRGVFESHGFVPLMTPALEPLDVLGKEDLEDESGTGGGSIFKVADPQEPGAFVGLRYDMTVPLARVVAQYQELQRPFRRYQVGPVWRVDKPAPGRFREFVQFDLDVVGTSEKSADTEIIACMVETLEALSIPRFLVRINDRKVLQGLLLAAGVPDEERTVEVDGRTVSYDVRMETLRCLDKLDRLGVEGVLQLLGTGRRDETGDFKHGVGLDASQVDVIRRYLAIGKTSRRSTLEELRALLGHDELAAEGIAELDEIGTLLDALGVGEDRACFDPTIVRGLAYYTGPVFEAVLLDAPEFGSVFSGGRYDGLVRRFQGQEVPAVGASVGVDRLLVALRHLGLVSARASTADVLVTTMDRGRQADYFAIASTLRRDGIPTEVYLGKGGLPKQLKYADKLGIPIAIVAGGDEFERGEVSIKDLVAGAEAAKEIEDSATWRENPTQVTVARGELVARVRAMLERLGR